MDGNLSDHRIMKSTLDVQPFKTKVEGKYLILVKYQDQCQVQCIRGLHLFIYIAKTSGKLFWVVYLKTEPSSLDLEMICVKFLYIMYFK